MSQVRNDIASTCEVCGEITEEPLHYLCQKCQDNPQLLKVYIWNSLDPDDELHWSGRDSYIQIAYTLKQARSFIRDRMTAEAYAGSGLGKPTSEPEVRRAVGWGDVIYCG